MQTRRFVNFYAAVALVSLLLIMVAPAVFGATTIGTSITTGGDLAVTGNTTITGNATISGNTTLGDAATDTITVTGKLAGGSLFFVKEVAAELSVQDSTTAATAGAALSITGATGATTGAGGEISIGGGTGGTTGGNGGAITIFGGAATHSAANGGNIVIRGGAKGSAGTDGTVTIGATNTSTIGIGYANGTTTITGFTQHSAGSVSLPSISFSGDTNTGIFALAADTLALVSGGFTQISVGTGSAATVTLGTTTLNTLGSVTTPAIAFSGDTNTGIFASAADTLQLVAGGLGQITVGTGSAAVVTLGTTTLSSLGSVTTPALAFSGDTNTGIIGAAIGDVLKLVAGGYAPFQIGTSSDVLNAVSITGSSSVSGNMLHGDGLVGRPAITFSADPDTGIYRSTANTLDLVVGGGAFMTAGSSTQYVTITGTTTIAGSTTITTGPFTVPAGSVGAPSIIFTGDSDTGLFASAANTLQLVAGGYPPLSIGTSSITLSNVNISGTTTVTGNVLAGNGTVGNPAFSFDADPDTGVRRSAANTLDLIAGGNASLSIGSSSTTLTGVTIVGSTSVTGAIIASAGSVSAPSVAFTGDSNTGIFASAADTLALVSGGFTQISVGTGSAATVTIGTTTLNTLGSLTTPAINFTGDTNTGIYSSGSDQVDIVTNGTSRLTVDDIGTGSAPLLTITGSTTITGNLTAGSGGSGGSTTLDIAGTATTIALCHANADDNDEPIVDCSGAPSDIAEYYETTSDTEAGDVVVTTQNFITYEGVRNINGTVSPGKNQTLSVLAKSSSSYQSNIVGIVSTAPYQLFGEDVQKAAKHPMPIALAGRVPVKVTNENGAIRAGDWLAASSKSGYAMKATGAGYAVGIALANFDGQNGKILALVQPGYVGAAKLQGGETTNVQTTSTAASLDKVEKLTVQKNATIQGRLIVKGNARFDGQISVGKDTAGALSVKAGQKTARLDFSAPYKKMPAVTATPLGNPGGYFWLSDVSENGFTVNVSKAPTQDLAFNWISLGSTAGLGEEEAKAKIETAAGGATQ